MSTVRPSFVPYVAALVLALASLTGCGTPGSFGPQPKVAPGPINVASAEGNMNTSGPARPRDLAATRYSLPVGRSNETGAMRPRR